MQVRLAAKVAAKVEGIRQLLNYQTSSDTVNLLLDAIKHQWDLKLTNLSQIETKDVRVRLATRNIEWMSQYGDERGIDVTAVTNLLISEYLADSRQTVGREVDRPQTEKPTQQPLDRPQTATEKPKGQALMRSLKL